MSRRTIRKTAKSNVAQRMPLSAQGLLRRYALLSGMGLSVIAPTFLPGNAHAAPAFGSPAWFAQQSTRPRGPSGDTPGVNLPGAVVTSQQAQIRAQRSIADLSRAAQAIADAQARQAAARQAALGAGCQAGVDCVTDGLTTPDQTLQPGYLPGLEVDPNVGSNPALWQNAELPTQTTANGQTTVDIKQTAPKAILTWQSFNVGRNTTVDFDQSSGTQGDGSNNWVALNRIDKNADPTHILGTIKADGSVYLIDPNGIIFGGSSQVNVHSLVASSLSMFSSDTATSNNVFLTQGIGAVNGALLTLPSDSNGQIYTPGDITIEQGASISTGDLGFALIAAPSLTNAGTVTAKDGQVALAAALQVNTATTGGSTRVDVGLPLYLTNPVDAAPTELVNTGIVQSLRGNVTLLGTDVTQGGGGVVLATTSVSRAGSVTVIAADAGQSNGGGDTIFARSGAVVLAKDSLTAILPAQDGETTTSGTMAALAFQDVLNQGGVTLRGGSVTLQNGSLLEAPGANVAITAMQTQFSAIPAQANVAGYGRVYIDDGATVDAAGLADVQLPMSANLVTIPRVGQNELADSPLQRDGILYRSPITVDGRDSGTRDDGLSWVGTPIASVGGYVQQAPQTINQLLVNGGKVTLTGQEVITHSGSTINIEGGYVHYLGGTIATTRLLSADGRIYDVSQADPDARYSGFAGQFTQQHSRWNTDFTYVNPLISGAMTYESDYVRGGNAGSLNIVLESPTQYSPSITQSAVLNGTVLADALAGRHQISSAAPPAGGSFSIVAAASSDGSNRSAPSFVVVDHVTDVNQIAAPDCQSNCAVFVANTALPGQGSQDPTNPSSVAYWTQLSATDIADAGFSRVTIDGRARGDGVPDGQIVVNSALSVQPGGSITLTGAKLAVNANLTAPAGAISLTATGQTPQPNPSPTAPLAAITYNPGDRGDIVVGSDVVISARGQWVNDAFLTADQQSGGAFINGGSISLVTDTNVVNLLSGSPVETSGVIRLEPGSLLDVSSGGRVLPSGVVATKNGVPIGKGGNISLITYGPKGADNISVLPSGQTLSTGGIDAEGTGGVLDLRSHLRAYGFSGGGSLTMQAMGFQIGSSDASLPGAVQLGADFFDGQGFGSYKLTSMLGSTITKDTVITPVESNFVAGPNGIAVLAGLATGADLYSAIAQHPGDVAIGKLDDYHRQATAFSLRAGDAFFNPTGQSGAGGAGIVVDPSNALVNYFAGTDGTLLLDKGAKILADAGASVTLGSRYQVTVLGEVVAHGGSITLSADSQGTGYSVPPSLATVGIDFPYGVYYGDGKSLWLGQNSLLDVSGVALYNPLQAPVISNGQRVTPHTGKLLDGGSVILSDDSGYVIAESGAKIDISGAAATFDLAQANTSDGIGNLRYVATPVWSDAGSITIGASSGLLFDASLQAQPGSPKGQGGSLTVAALNKATTVVLSQAGPFVNGSFVPAGLTPGADPLAGGTLSAGTLYLSAEHLKDTGVSSLTVGSRIDSTVNVAPVTIAFDGGFDLSLGRAFVANAANYVQLQSSTSDGTAGGGCGEGLVDCIAAPYVQLAGYFNNGALQPVVPVTAPSADAQLNIQARTIDLSGTFAIGGFGKTHFTSSGDIRFYTPAEHDYHASTQLDGELFTSGDLTFTAAQLYPASGNTFVIAAVAPAGSAGTTVTIEPNGTSTVPLSAGGNLLIDASHIVQSGTIRAPSGTIVLGVGDASDADTIAQFNNLPLVTTQSVQLAAGSLTSVSLDGITVPYGTTLDGQNWQYNGNPNPVQTAGNLVAPPSKQILINAGAVDLDSGATVDLSGGGHLQAQEWIAGTGGSRNVLSQYSNSYSGGTQLVQTPQYADGRAIYAIVPGYAAPAAPYDPVLYQGQGSLTVGQSVYLSGAPGLPAGVYTLLPAQYATLPGAYRIVQDTSAIDTFAGQNAVLADGTLRVAGNFVDAYSGAQTARSTAFLVQSGGVWRQYSQYTLSDADSFFSKQAARAGTVSPLLPMDAGRLALGAGSDLRLGATLDTAAAKGGAGAQVDLASTDLQIVGNGENALSGYVQISVAELDALGASSLLIGGTRSRTSSGDVVTAISNNVVVSTDADDPLFAPEIILVSKAGSTGDPNAANGLRVDAGSVIQAKGTVAAGADVPIIIGRDAASGVSAVSGDGALLRVSNGAPVAIVRNDVPANATGLLDIRAGAVIDGGASVTLDSTGDTRLDPSAVFSAKAIDANSGLITFIGDNANGNGNGLVVGPQTLAQFANAQQITLRSRGAIDFVGDINVTLNNVLTLGAGDFHSDGGNVNLTAATLRLTNDLDARVPTFTAGSGTLNLNAGEIGFGAGSKTVTGFGSVTATATGGIVGQGAGQFDFGSLPVTLNTPIVVADQGSDSVLKTSGQLIVNAVTSDKPLTAKPIGGALTLIGGSVNIDAPMQALAGDLKLEATTGDLQLGDKADLSVNGVSKTFFDVVQYASAGNLKLSADQGSVVVGSGASLNFAADAGGGNAGSLTIAAVKGNVQLGGTLNGSAAEAAGYQGGSFSLDVGSAVDLDALVPLLAAGGIDRQIAVHSRDGNLLLTQTLRAQSVTLTADGGSGGRNDAAGNVIVANSGVIDASGTQGGGIALYGKSGVDIEGQLLAGSAGGEARGGTVTLGTSGVSNGTVDAQYGYENVTAANSGTITIGSGAVIDVSGSTGGVVHLRAPLLTSSDVNVDVANTAQVKGARSITMEAYATWSSADSYVDASKHFDGIIDPAGNFTSGGARVSGVFVDADGKVLGSAGDPATDFFVPNAVNNSHADFYQSTLMSFVQGPGFAFENRLNGNTALQDASGHSLVQATPGIDLINPDGDISVLSNWNLGAGTSDPGTGYLSLSYRYQNNIAPILTLRAAGNVQVNASISDGFFNTSNPFKPLQSQSGLDNSVSPAAARDNPMPLLSANLDGLTVDADGRVVPVNSSSYRLVAGGELDSSNPLALDAAAVSAGRGDITLDKRSTTIFRFVPMFAPTMIRTGTGSIDIAAANDVKLLDPFAPGVIYTGGRPADGTTASTAAYISTPLRRIIEAGGGDISVTFPGNYIVTGPVNPVDAGDISISAAHDIVGIEKFDTLWGTWMQLGNVTDSATGSVLRSSINYGAFDQGVLSAGGNVDIAAGNDIRDLSVSLPTTWDLSMAQGGPFGGGDLTVKAGHDILSGSYFVSRGSGVISADGKIAADLTRSETDPNGNSFTVPLSTLFALQDASLQVQAREGADIAGVLNPSYYQNLNGLAVDSQTYSSSSSFSALATTGDLSFGTLPESLSYQVDNVRVPDILPASLRLTALDGGISVQKGGELYPSASGQLSLIAEGSITLSRATPLLNDAQGAGSGLGLIDAPETVLPSIAAQAGSPGALNEFLLPVASSFNYQLHIADPLHPLHWQDAVPVYVYSLDGSIVDGALDSAGLPEQLLTLVADKPASIRAGTDIVNLSFLGQNLYGSDVTRIIAGRDLYDTPYPYNAAFQQPMLLQLAGGGTFDIEAGRDIGPLTSANQQPQNNNNPSLPGAGIVTVGNAYNPYLQHSGADILTVFGVAPGIDTQGFEAKYIDPSASLAGIPSYSSQLIQFVQNYENDQLHRSGQAGGVSLTADQAWTDFRQMPLYQQQRFVYSVYFDILNRTGLDYNDSRSPYYQDYTRGYTAVETLFPSAYGYTANNLGKGVNGSPQPVFTGNLDMRGSTLQTQQGGSIAMLGPGGNVLVGSTAALPYAISISGKAVAIGPNQQGILTLEKGNISIFADQSVLLAQSRIFTEQGGDVLIWSSNGDVNAGKGAKTNSEVPPPQYLCDFDHYCRVDAKSQVSGAGIATLQTVPDAKAGTVNLIAPAGTVDAGDAGIRASGNLNVAALHVANADNIQVQGQSVGATSGAVDSGALSSASGAAAAANQAAEDLARTHPPESAATVITVEVVGYGTPGEENKKKLRKNGT